MKKLLGIVVLGLFWVVNAFAHIENKFVYLVCDTAGFNERYIVTIDIKKKTVKSYKPSTKKATERADAVAESEISHSNKSTLLDRGFNSCRRERKQERRFGFLPFTSHHSLLLPFASFCSLLLLPLAYGLLSFCFLLLLFVPFCSPFLPFASFLFP